MKILVISNYYPPYYIGGYELSCKSTVEYLKQQGHEVFVLTGNYKKQSSEVENIERKLHYINYEKPSFMNKHCVETYNYKLTQEITLKFKPDLVYFWSLRLVSLSPAVAVENLKVKKIFEIGDLWMKGYLSNTFFSKLKRCIKRVLPFTISSKVELSPSICVSSWIAKKMQKTYFSKKVYVIPNGVEVFDQKPKKLSPTTKYIFSGRVDHSKGVDLALKALGSLKEKGFSDFIFDIYGTGDEDYMRKCKNIVEVLHLNKEVTFCGHKENIQDYYPHYDVLLMPTRMKEPFGLVIIEAMALGVVVIATDGYGPAEIIEDEKDGLLFEREDENDLSKKILLLHNNCFLYEQLREAAYIKVKEKYDLKKVKKEVENILLKSYIKA